jgi:hypothetical protein
VACTVRSLPRTLLAALLFLCIAARAQAVAPVVTAAAAAQAVPVVKEGASFVKEVAAIPISAGEILCLPWGVVECVFSPLPNVSFRSGLGHIGTGIVAPFKLVEAVVSLPYHAVVAVGNACDKVVPSVK